MLALSQSLETAKGPKVSGYLKKSTKAQVDAIVDELAKIPEVAECSATWTKLRDELEGYYKDTPRQHLPISQQKEFRAIKNLVIQEAEALRPGVFTFEDADMTAEPAETLPENCSYQTELDYWESVDVLDDNYATQAEKQRALQTLNQLWDNGLAIAAHQLGRAYRDGLGVLPDDEKAKLWFRHSAEAGNDCSQDALGTLLLEQGRSSEAVSWYEQAAATGNQYAQYDLGKLYLQSKSIPQNVSRAEKYLTVAAEQGNQYAQYALGKLYLSDNEIPQNKEQAAY